MARKTIKEGPHPLDIAMGMRVRLRRKEMGLSQDHLARAVGITFQQIQKYEHGTNRISFSRLVEICGALKCRLADLIGDLETCRSTGAQTRQTEQLAKTGASALLSAYAQIPSGKQRRAVLNLTRQLAAEQQSEDRSQSRKGR